MGFLIFQPIVYPRREWFDYPVRHVLWAFVTGLLNALGAWAILAAMRDGGKALIVGPFTALYPIVVVIGAPIILRESISVLQGIGLACRLVALILLFMEDPLPRRRECTCSRGGLLLDSEMLAMTL